jgi:hypothetical protein
MRVQLAEPQPAAGFSGGDGREVSPAARRRLEAFQISGVRSAITSIESAATSADQHSRTHILPRRGEWSALGRDLLNHLSDWVLGPLSIGLSIAIALAGLMLVRRFLSGWRDAEASQTIVGVAAMVMTLFALVLAFVVVNLYSGYVSAADSVSAEASSLRTLVRDAQAFPAAERLAINRAVADYVTEVRTREFPMLRSGHEDIDARRRLTGLFATVQSYSPTTESQQTFYQSATEQLDAITDERQQRIEAAESSIPGPLLALMIITALVTLAMTVLLKTHRDGLDIVLVVSVAVIVGAGIFTAVILEYPFSGSIAVSSAPFARTTAGV